ncbi:membrane protein [Catellatospora sp. TT07R-123]|uniref:SanA/YdcF family protein n=1 Tax=Catellatospora sp. TT07R-123 TaxID=2733863 RepID=UPI001B0D243A|nr:ElyC/SanA/YdcF family protein [Catellatospora sp. TT07R-123]GHJ44500.1 membrane protein [Catellatospora sp. TT07R-123]
MSDDQPHPDAADQPDTGEQPAARPAPGRLTRWRRRAVRVVLWGTLAGVLVAAGSIGWIRWSAAGHVYSVQDVPQAPVALVLGAKVHDTGVPSAFLEARLAIAKELYDTGKVRAILVSGDHAQWSYDEPDTMRDWLVRRGVPFGKVVTDHAGFDTYDSCQRAARIFGVQKAIVVTQSYHIARAVTLCRDAGIETDGVADDSVRRFESFWTQGVIREQGACVKAAFDTLTGRDPVFLGRHETGVEDALRD